MAQTNSEVEHSKESLEQTTNGTDQEGTQEEDGAGGMKLPTGLLKTIVPNSTHRPLSNLREASS
jgi:protein TIF31